MGGINVYIGEPANALSLLRTAMRLNPTQVISTF